MNNICLKLNNLFNNKIAKKIDNNFYIIESDANATLKEIEIENNDSIIFIDNKILDYLDPLFKGNNLEKDVKLNTGCDGVFLTCIDNNWFVILIELKSSFTTNNIVKAKNQIQATYPKIQMILSMLDVDLNLNEIKPLGFIVTRKVELTKKTIFLKKSTDYRFKICKGFINKGTVNFSKSDYLGKLPLNKDYCFDEISIHYINSENKSLLNIRNFI